MPTTTRRRAAAATAVWATVLETADLLQLALQYRVVADCLALKAVTREPAGAHDVASVASVATRCLCNASLMVTHALNASFDSSLT